MHMLNLLELHKGRSWQSRAGKTKAHAVTKKDRPEGQSKPEQRIG